MHHVPTQNVFSSPFVISSKHWLSKRQLLFKDGGQTSCRTRKLITTGAHQTYWIAKDATSSLRKTDKFAYFCDTICETYIGIRPEKLNDDPFNAEFAAANLGPLVFAHISAPSHTAKRDNSMLRTQPDEHLYLNFSPFYNYTSQHLGHDGTVTANTAFLIDNQHRFDVAFEQNKRMSLYSPRIPKSALAADLTPSETNAIKHAHGHSPVGYMTAAQMRLMCTAFDKDDLPSTNARGTCVLSLINSLTHQDHPNPDGVDTNAFSISAIDPYVRENMYNPDFSISEVAKIFGVSTRTIQNKFAKQGLTFSPWLLQQRLEKARALLSNPTNRLKSIESIAFSCGFRDATHF